MPQFTRAIVRPPCSTFANGLTRVDLGKPDSTRALHQHEREHPNDERHRSVRSPWRWERLLAESRVVATGDRWQRRLHGLAHECRIQKTELERTDPDSPRIDHLQRKIDDVLGLATFAVPIMRALAEWPVQASWAEWLDRFDHLAPRVLKWPDRVLRVLADLRPMGAIAPVTLAEAMVVLADRLASIELDPPPRRYGRKSRRRQ